MMRPQREPEHECFISKKTGTFFTSPNPVQVFSDLLAQQQSNMYSVIK